MIDNHDQLLKPAASQAEVIVLNGLRIHVIRSARRRTLSLEVGHTGVKARAPERMDARTIRKFILSKEHWIRRNLDSLPIIAEPLRLQDGCELMVLGETYRLQISTGRAAVRVNQTGQIIVPTTSSHLPLEQSVRRKLVKWYKQVAMQHLALRVGNRIAVMLPGTPMPAVKVRDYRRRWGSCDHRGNLSFNWRIAMAPASVLEYVVVHELAHLREFNHSRKFWRLVEQQIPDWKQAQKWLSENGSLLYRF